MPDNDELGPPTVRGGAPLVMVGRGTWWVDGFGMRSFVEPSVDDDRQMARFFHVTSSLNRASIRAHGLDWTRMGAAKGIAGSPTPEQEGCFVARDEFEADFFVRFAREGTVDVWAVEGIDASELVESPEGFTYVPRRIPAEDLQLDRADARVS